MFGLTLVIAAMVSDHSSPAQNAGRRTWPRIQMILCWPHMFREVCPPLRLVSTLFLPAPEPVTNRGLALIQVAKHKKCDLSPEGRKNEELLAFIKRVVQVTHL